MEIKHSNTTSNLIPEIYCAVSILFDEGVDLDQIISELKLIGIFNTKIRHPKYRPIICNENMTLEETIIELQQDEISSLKPRDLECEPISLKGNIDLTQIIGKLKQFGINNTKDLNIKCEPIVWDPKILLEIATVNYEKFWDLDKALMKMFAQIDHCLAELNEIIKRKNGDVTINIVFYQYGTYPVLGFSRENVEKIHFLNASISIDAY